MSGLMSAAAKRLRDALALVTGAGLVGYSNAQAYGAGTLGAGLKAEETARANAVTAVANDVATLTASVGALSDEVDANATAASNATAAVQADVDALEVAKAAKAGDSTQAFSVAASTLAEHATRLGQFAATMAENGSQRLPSGLIIKWVRATYVEPPSPGTVNFAEPFPNQCFGAVAGAGLGAAAFVTGIGATVNGVTFYVDESASISNGGTIFFVAIGF